MFRHVFNEVVTILVKVSRTEVEERSNNIDYIVSIVKIISKSFFFDESVEGRIRSSYRKGYSKAYINKSFN